MRRMEIIKFYHLLQNIMWKKIFLALLFTLPALNSYAIVVQVPNSQGQSDVAVTGPTQVQGDESSFFQLLQTINQYLRFGIGVVCMVVLVMGGFKLMTASGNPEKLKQANKLLMWALIGILISLLSYSIIRLVVNLF